MDMTDNELLEQLFQPMKEMQVADNGFTERVMQQLPADNRALKLSRLWTAFCVVVAVTLFVLMRGWELIGHALLMLLNNLPSTQHLLMLTVSVGVVGLLALTEFVHHERYGTI